MAAPHKPYALLPAAHPLAKKCGDVTGSDIRIAVGCGAQQKFFISIFKENGYYPEVASSPSIEMVRCMVGQAGLFGAGDPALFDMTYDGQRLVQLDIVDEMAASTLIMAYLQNNEPTRPTRLFMDYCRSVELTPAVSSH
jgi:DNA-binding transcriptional LysR family regulator